jgi:FecR protein
MPRFKALLLTLSLATLSVAAFGQIAGNVPSPGTINYIEGQASIEGRPLSPASVGNTALQAGQVIATANGKAEILLTPGIFLRLGNDTTVQMVSPDLTHTEVQLQQGLASIEVDQIYPQNTILVDMNKGQTQLLKTGLYAFDAATSTLRVFDGKAAVYPGANLQANVKPIDVKGSHQLALNGEPLKPQSFNKDQAAAADPLYRWSSLRSDYLGEANLRLAEQYEGYPAVYPGWYWAGGPFGYTWLPGDGLFWSPFGYGFYSPFYLRGGGFYRGGFAGHAVGGGFRGGAVGGGGFHGGGGGHR